MTKYKNDSGWTVNMFNDCGAKYTIYPGKTLTIQDKIVNLPSGVTIIKEREQKKPVPRHDEKKEEKENKESDK